MFCFSTSVSWSFCLCFSLSSSPEAGLSATRRRQSVQDKWQKQSFLQLLPGGYLYILAAVAKIPRLVLGEGCFKVMMQLISLAFLPLRKFPNMHGSLRNYRRSYPTKPQPSYCANNMAQWTLNSKKGPHLTLAFCGHSYISFDKGEIRHQISIKYLGRSSLA